MKKFSLLAALVAMTSGTAQAEDMPADEAAACAVVAQANNTACLKKAETHYWDLEACTCKPRVCECVPANADDPEKCVPKDTSPESCKCQPAPAGSNKKCQPVPPPPPTLEQLKKRAEKLAADIAKQQERLVAAKKALCEKAYAEAKAALPAGAPDPVKDEFGCPPEPPKDDAAGGGTGPRSDVTPPPSHPGARGPGGGGGGAGGVGGATAAELAKLREEVEAAVRALRGEITAINEALGKEWGTPGSERLRVIERRLDDVEKKVTDLRTDVDDLKTRVAALEDKDKEHDRVIAGLDGRVTALEGWRRVVDRSLAGLKEGRASVEYKDAGAGPYVYAAPVVGGALHRKIVAEGGQTIRSEASGMGGGEVGVGASGSIWKFLRGRAGLFGRGALRADGVNLGEGMNPALGGGLMGGLEGLVGVDWLMGGLFAAASFDRVKATAHTAALSSVGAVIGPVVHANLPVWGGFGPTIVARLGFGALYDGTNVYRPGQVGPTPWTGWSPTVNLTVGIGGTFDGLFRYPLWDLFKRFVLKEDEKPATPPPPAPPPDAARRGGAPV